KELNFAVEAGSAGEAVANDNGFKVTPVKDQASALMEVKSGTADAAVIDLLMAMAMTGEGTSYADLTYTAGLNDEKYGVAFRTGSDLVDSLNAFFVSNYADIEKVAETYGLTDALIEQK
ncbi:MAG: transporter substrate-binding domain-containing protein, partial [Clostridia bacterium]|nr:transporter substrate-binding domain-containing protein [Clostridia bacterium]